MNSKFFSISSEPSQKYLLPLFSLLVAVTFGLFPIDDADIFWHLKSGEWIFDHLKVPYSDIFSYTAFGNRWIHHEWGSSLVFFILMTFFGVYGLNIFAVILFWGYLYLGGRAVSALTRSNTISFLVVFLLGYLSLERVHVRPHMFTNLFMAYLLYELYKWQDSTDKDKKIRLFLFPLLFLLWANLHGGVLIGITLLIVNGIGVGLQSFRETKIFFSDKSLLVLILFCSLIVLANPYFFHIYTFPFEHMKLTGVLARTMEWAPPFEPLFRKRGVFQGYFFLLGLTLIVVLLRLRHQKLGRLFMGGILGYLSIRHSRYTALFSLWALPFLTAEIRNFGWSVSFSSFLKRRGALPTGRLLLFFVLIYFLMGGVPVEWGVERQKIGLGIYPDRAPYKAVDFLLENEMNERIYTKDDFGSFLVYFGIPAFIDGRAPVYDEKFWLEAVRSHNDPATFERLWKRYDFGALFLPLSWKNQMMKLHQYLLRNPEWAVVYWDDYSVVYLDRREANIEIIKKYHGIQSK